MYYVHLDASSGVSGDMLLAAFLDLGVSPSLFKQEMDKLGLSVKIEIKETQRTSLRGLKVDVQLLEQRQMARKWADVKKLIQEKPLPDSVIKNALRVFKNLFQAESKVHGCPFHEVHLHEVGADDAIIDIVGFCYLYHILKIKDFYSSPLNLGKGWVKTDHGLLPVPPPAVAELLKNKPVYSAHAQNELVTPTGAAIVSTLCKQFIQSPELCYEKIGYGAGTRNIPGFPNILRAFYGNIKKSPSDHKIYMIETNIDDSNPEILSTFFEKAFQKGALDVYLTPIFMKKNRLATKLTLLGEIDKIDSLIKEVFRETSSIGVRYFPVQRRILERKTQKVNIQGQNVRIKTAYLEGEEVNIHPELEDCLRLSKSTNIPLKKILHLALKEYSKKRKHPSEKT
ncbi:nickel pincer cofactor biosynthesis protein LarC [bacterium]|nr:nickel pincer cofactor biosynthesis protein LarC [bacterium]